MGFLHRIHRHFAAAGNIDGTASVSYTHLDVYKRQSDDSLLKMLYLATMDITKKWTGRRRD